ncbi:MAG: hypothetical protein MUC31_05850 [Bacteroidales bacterium]|jgi:hypothetical protein|nr:hypothetical protein [Bacteroidales bacterium]
MKLVKWIGSSLFNFSDKFFKGYNDELTLDSERILPAGPVENCVCMSWELNQGVEDILFKDIKVSLNILFPHFVRKRAGIICRKLLLYFELDFIEAEEDQAPLLTIFPAKNSCPISQEKKLSFADNNVRKKVCANTLYLTDWMKAISLRLKTTLKVLYPVMPFNLFESFRTTGHYTSNTITDSLARGPDKSKITLPLFYHKRN